MEYTIRQFKREDLNDYLNLYERIFGTQWGKEWFQWKYECPSVTDSPPIIVAEYNDELVGARSYFPLRIVASGQEYPVLQPCDTMVAEAHRGNGVFTQMNEYGLEVYDDIPLMFNFPNHRSLPGNLNLGWEGTGKFEQYYFVPDPGEIVEERLSGALGTIGGQLASLAAASYYGGLRSVSTMNDKLSVKRTDETPATTLATLHERTCPAAIHAARDTEFYEWRFSRPGWDYRTYLGERDGKIVAAAIFGTRDRGLVRTNIVDMLPMTIDNSPELRRVLLDGIQDHQDTDYFVAGGTTLPRSDLRRLGFLPDSSPPLSFKLSPKTMVVREVGGWDGDLTDHDSWAISIAEVDTS